MALLDLIRGSKTGEKIAVEVRASTFAEREELVAERTRAVEARDCECEPLACAVRDADARVAALEAELNNAREAARQAKQALAMRQTQGDAVIRRIDWQLEAGADPKIIECFRALDREIEFARTHSAPSPQLAPYLDGLRRAQRECVDLKREAVSDVGAALAEIRARIPSKFSTLVAA